MGGKIYMEDKRKIAAKSGQLRYYTERKYEESPILKSMDPYRQELPIGYAKTARAESMFGKAPRIAGMISVLVSFMPDIWICLLSWTVWIITMLSHFLI